MSKNTFEVEFSGNGPTPESMVYDYALLRAAEVTIEKGYKYFTVLESKVLEQVGAGYREHNIIRCSNKKPVTDRVVYEAMPIERSLKKKYSINN